MIQMTLIQIDNYGPWTVTPRPRTESDLQMLQASLFADLNNHFGNKKGLVFFTRFDNLLAISNGLDEEDHLRIQRSIRIFLLTKGFQNGTNQRSFREKSI